MDSRPESSSAKSEPAAVDDEEVQDDIVRGQSQSQSQSRPRRSPLVWLTLFALITYSSWAVYQYQYESLPPPLTAEQAGKRGFSEVEAMKHVKALTQLGPHPVGSDALDLALQVLVPKYVLFLCVSFRSSVNNALLFGAVCFGCGGEDQGKGSLGGGCSSGLFSFESRCESSGQWHVYGENACLFGSKSRSFENLAKICI